MRTMGNTKKDLKKKKHRLGKQKGFSEAKGGNGKIPAIGPNTPNPIADTLDPAERC